MKDMKSKQMSSKAGPAVSGGGSRMSGKNYVGPQVPGQGASMGQKTNAPVAKAGGKAMAPQSGAAPSMSGQASVGGRKGNNTFAPDTGGSAMAGYTGSQNAKPC